MTPARWAALVVALLMLVAAVQGGEYSTTDILALRAQERQEADQVKVLRRVVDSLSRAAKAVETDPAVQERIARERFGMIGKGELLYRLIPDSTAGDGTLDPSPTPR